MGKDVNKTHPSGTVLTSTDTRTVAGVVTCKNKIYRQFSWLEYFLFDPMIIFNHEKCQ